MFYDVDFFCSYAREEGCLKSRPSRGSTVRPFYDTITKRFLLTRPSRGATGHSMQAKNRAFISTHTPLAGRDGEILQNAGNAAEFLLTRPSRGATSCSKFPALRAQISTHTPLAGRDEIMDRFGRILDISTHTPLAGRDRATRRIRHTG